MSRDRRYGRSGRCQRSAEPDRCRQRKVRGAHRLLKQDECRNAAVDVTEAYRNNPDAPKIGVVVASRHECAAMIVPLIVALVGFDLGLWGYIMSAFNRRAPIQRRQENTRSLQNAHCEVH